MDHPVLSGKYKTGICPAEAGETATLSQIETPILQTITPTGPRLSADLPSFLASQSKLAERHTDRVAAEHPVLSDSSNSEPSTVQLGNEVATCHQRKTLSSGDAHCNLNILYQNVRGLHTQKWLNSSSLHLIRITMLS